LILKHLDWITILRLRLSIAEIKRYRLMPQGFEAVVRL